MQLAKLLFPHLDELGNVVAWKQSQAIFHTQDPSVQEGIFCSNTFQKTEQLIVNRC
jgi:hypothetical protein